MFNVLSDLKKMVGIKPYVLDMNDSEKLSNDETEFEKFLLSSSDNALSLIESWEYEIPEIPAEDRKLLRCEILLVKAEIMDEFGFMESIDPMEVKVGGAEGEVRKVKKFSVEERGEMSAQFRNRAYRTLFGRDPVMETGIA
jgi:hypothetical protein